MNLLGCNVTVPYKSEVLPFLKEIDPLAKSIGAVNTLVREEGGYKGYNTDMPGLYRAFVRDHVKIRDEKVLILGAGGVARAVAMLLWEKKAERIVILNRSLEKAKEIAEEINALAGEEKVEVCSLAEYESLAKDGPYLVIQATSVGMYPKCDEAVVEEESFYKMVHTGYDLIFNPPETRFMSLTKKAGGRAFNGARMLLYQGIIAYELWTGKEIAEELADRVFLKMKHRKENIVLDRFYGKRQIHCGTQAFLSFEEALPGYGQADRAEAEKNHQRDLQRRRGRCFPDNGNRTFRGAGTGKMHQSDRSGRRNTSAGAKPGAP